MPDFARLKSPILISRKIWVVEKSWNFHTVNSHLGWEMIQSRRFCKLQADLISVSQQTAILVFQTRKKQFKEQFDCVKEISETFQCEEIWTYICRSHRRWPRCWRQLELYRLKIVKKIRQNTFENKFWKVKNRLLMPRMTFRVCPYWATSSMNDSRAWKRKSCVSVYQNSKPWYLND